MVRLAPMAADQFGPYIEQLIQTYAQEHIRTGRWSAQEGVAEARKEVERLLPKGRETADHYFFSIRAGEPPDDVGVLWLAIEPRGGFVYDLLIFERFRRHGYAEQAMRLVEAVAKEKGARKLSLHVFANNAGARRLYSKLGFIETDLVLSKPIGA